MLNMIEPNLQVQVTYKRLRDTLDALSRAKQERKGELPDVLFGGSDPKFAANHPAWTPVNKNLDQSQVRAVSKALSAQHVALIHGPPGTGKTTAVVELILQEAAKGHKVGNMHLENFQAEH